MHVLAQLLSLATLMDPPLQPPAAQQGSLLQADQGVGASLAERAQSGEGAGMLKRLMYRCASLKGPFGAVHFSQSVSVIFH